MVFKIENLIFWGQLGSGLGGRMSSWRGPSSTRTRERSSMRPPAASTPIIRGSRTGASWRTAFRYYKYILALHFWPDGRTSILCLLTLLQVWPHKNSWNDYRCGYRAVSFCNIEGRPRFKIRGIDCEVFLNRLEECTTQLGEHHFLSLLNCSLSRLQAG